MTSLKTFGLLALLAAATPAVAVLPLMPDYRIVTVNDKAMILMDFTSRTRVDSNTVRAWTALYYRTPQPFEHGSSDTLDYVLSQAHYDCGRTGRYQLQLTEGFQAADAIRPVYHVSETQPWEIAEADTMGMKNWDAACNGVPEKYDYTALTGESGNNHPENLATYRRFIETDRAP